MAALRAALAAALAAIRFVRAAVAPWPPALRRACGAASRGLRSRAAVVHAAVRRRPDAALVALLLAGVLLMVIHWRGAAAAPPLPERDTPAQHAVAGP